MRKNIYLNNIINGVFSIFVKKFLNIFEAGFPVIYLRKSKEKGWIIKVIQKSFQLERSLHNIIKNCDDLKMKMYYKSYCSISRRIIKEAKKL